MLLRAIKFFCGYVDLRQTNCHLISNRMLSLRNSTICMSEDAMDFEEVEKTLNSLILKSYIRRPARNLKESLKFFTKSGISLSDLDNLSIIHVSGTKGKGSTCALTENILRLHNIKTGLFTSPHLEDVTERIRINGKPISKNEFCKSFWTVFNRIKDATMQNEELPSYFQLLTVLCFHIFLKEKVDVAIVEVGIGGELDCTNVIRNTTTVGITSLGLDHVNILGNTLEEIAWQKAGIIKSNLNVFTTVNDPVCLKVIEERAKAKNSKVYVVPNIKDYVNLNSTENLCFDQLNRLAELNGSLAVQLAYDWMRRTKKCLPNEILLNSCPAVLYDIVYKGLINCLWSGRFEILHFNNINLYLDGAHTLESIKVCSEWFQLSTKSNKFPKVLIFNVTSDRDSRKLMEILKKYITFTTVCFVPNIAYPVGSINANPLKFGHWIENRTQIHAQNWYELTSNSGIAEDVQIFSSVYDCFCYLMKHFANERIDVLTTGSLHLIGSIQLVVKQLQMDLK